MKKIIVLCVFISLILSLLFIINKSLKILDVEYGHVLNKTYEENIYTEYWKAFKKKNFKFKGNPKVLLSRHVAYRVYKERTKNLLLRVFFEWFIKVYLDKKEQMNIMLSSDIYIGGAKGIQAASFSYFDKPVFMLSDEELTKLFLKIY